MDDRIAAEEQPQWLRNLRLDKRGQLNDSDIETGMEDRQRCACPLVRPTPFYQGVHVQLEELVIGFRHDRPTRITPAGASPIWNPTTMA